MKKLTAIVFVIGMVVYYGIGAAGAAKTGKNLFLDRNAKIETMMEVAGK